MNEPLARNLSRRTHPRKHPVHVESILSVDTVVFPSGSFVMEIMTQKMIHSHFSVVIQGSTMHKISIVGLSRFTCLSSNAQWEACTFLSKGITIRDIHSSDHQHALLSVSAFLSHITKIRPKKVKLTKNKIWMFFFNLSMVFLVCSICTALWLNQQEEGKTETGSRYYNINHIISHKSSAHWHSCSVWTKKCRLVKQAYVYISESFRDAQK